MVIDLTTDGHPRTILKLFEARGMWLGRENPSVSVLISEGADEYEAIQEAYRRLRATRGLNMERHLFPLCHDGETY